MHTCIRFLKCKAGHTFVLVRHLPYVISCVDCLFPLAFDGERGSVPISTFSANENAAPNLLNTHVACSMSYDDTIKYAVITL